MNPESDTTGTCEHVPKIVLLRQEWAKNKVIGPRPVFDPSPSMYGLFEPTWWQRVRFRLTGSWGGF